MWPRAYRINERHFSAYLLTDYCVVYFCVEIHKLQLVTADSTAQHPNANECRLKWAKYAYAVRFLLPFKCKFIHLHLPGDTSNARVLTAIFFFC